MGGLLCFMMREVGDRNGTLNMHDLRVCLLIEQALAFGASAGVLSLHYIIRLGSPTAKLFSRNRYACLF